MVAQEWLTRTRPKGKIKVVCKEILRNPRRSGRKLSKESNMVATHVTLFDGALLAYSLFVLSSIFESIIEGGGGPAR